MQFSKQYNDLIGVTGGDFDIIRRAKEMKSGQIETLGCAGFGNDFVKKDEDGNILLGFTNFESKRTFWYPLSKIISDTKEVKGLFTKPDEITKPRKALDILLMSLSVMFYCLSVVIFSLGDYIHIPKILCFPCILLGFGALVWHILRAKPKEDEQTEA